MLPCLPKDSDNLEKNNKISGIEEILSQIESNIITADIGFNQQIRAIISPKPDNCSGNRNSIKLKHEDELFFLLSFSFSFSFFNKNIV